MRDLFAVIRDLDCVARVTNLYPAHPLPLNLLFFLCPKLSNKGFTLNRLHTGLTGRYVEGLGKSTEARLDKVRQFAGQLEQVGIEYTITAIFAAADSLILFPHAAAPRRHCQRLTGCASSQISKQCAIACTALLNCMNKKPGALPQKKFGGQRQSGL